MSFEEWWKKEVPESLTTAEEKGMAKTAWDGCKKEMFEILNKHKKGLTNSDMEYLTIELIESDIDDL